MNEEIEKQITNVTVDDDSYTKKHFKEKFNEGNGFFISRVASAELREEILEIKETIYNSKLRKDKKSVETIHDYRVCVRQKVIIIHTMCYLIFDIYFF